MEKQFSKDIPWNIVIDETYRVLANTIHRLVLDSYSAGNLTKREILSAKEFSQLRPKSDSAKELIEIINLIESKFDKR